MINSMASHENHGSASPVHDEVERLSHNLAVTTETMELYKLLATERLAALEQVTKQRDELLAACKSVIAWDEWCGFRLAYAVHSKIHAAIASVKEK